ncbi:MAG: tRNA dihydrouridine synthase DusB [Propionibacteriaceae bacterium]|nr:tRNA dihydrouridine synthase DusB [Propionibacteriaceae bacterium]
MQTLPAYAPLVLPAPSRPGAVASETPVVLAPMAGVTNAAYRQLCREQAEAGGESGTGRKGLFVCEMITSRGLVERDRKSIDMLAFDPGETLHSVQLYGVDPATMAHATEILCNEFGVAHVDLNFGCPVPKVTRKGGGGVLPWKRDRLRAILTETVKAADKYGVPVTMKTRKGIDADHLTFLDAGRIAQESGVAAIALHGRTVAQSYSGEADWDSIAELVQAVYIPVLGNGDIWEADTALAMVAHTGCAGVVVGRGCLGRPWLFRDLADAFAGKADRVRPQLGEVAEMVRRHGELMAGIMGEKRGVSELRKHMAWYFKGYPVGGDARRGLSLVGSLAELTDRLGQLDATAPFPVRELGSPRGRQGSPRDKVVMPDGWLNDQSGLALDLSAAESDVSGG